MPRPAFMLFLTILSAAMLSSADAAEVIVRPAKPLPGDILVLELQGVDRPIESARADLDGATGIFHPGGSKHVTLVGIAAKKAPGSYKAKVAIRYPDGSGDLLAVPIRVGAKSFPTQRVRVAPSKGSLMSDEVLERERKILYAAFGTSSPIPLWSGRFELPIRGRVTSDFGKKRYVNGRFWGQHGGIDLAGKAGTPVKAPAAGKVALVEKLWMRGNTIVIDHGLGLFTMYNHLSRFAVKKGDAVTAGQVIGNVGSSGLSSGPHLHFEVRVGTVSVNPWNLIKLGLAVQ